MPCASSPLPPPPLSNPCDVAANGGLFVERCQTNCCCRKTAGSRVHKGCLRSVTCSWAPGEAKAAALAGGRWRRRRDIVENGKEGRDEYFLSVDVIEEEAARVDQLKREGQVRRGRGPAHPRAAASATSSASGTASGSRPSLVRGCLASGGSPLTTQDV